MVLCKSYTKAGKRCQLKKTKNSTKYCHIHKKKPIRRKTMCKKVVVRKSLKRKKTTMNRSKKRVKTKRDGRRTKPKYHRVYEKTYKGKNYRGKVRGEFAHYESSELPRFSMIKIPDFSKYTRGKKPKYRYKKRGRGYNIDITEY